MAKCFNPCCYVINIDWFDTQSSCTKKHIGYFLRYIQTGIESRNHQIIKKLPLRRFNNRYLM